MSTRAVYTFCDESSTHHVYQNHDGYPSGALSAIQAALPLAWQLPRFEPDEFAAAFVAANKSGGGGVRLTHNWVDHADIEYRYEIRYTLEAIRIRIYQRDWVSETWRLVDTGSLTKLINIYVKNGGALVY